MKKSPAVNAIIRAFCAAALPDHRGEIVEATPCCARGSDTFAEPVLERLLVGRPPREGSLRESVRQQTDQGVHDFGREFGVELGAPDGIAQRERLAGGLRVVCQRPRPGREFCDGLPVALLRRERGGDAREQRVASAFLGQGHADRAEFPAGRALFHPPAERARQMLVAEADAVQRHPGAFEKILAARHPGVRVVGRGRGAGHDDPRPVRGGRRPVSRGDGSPPFRCRAGVCYGNVPVHGCAG